MGVVASDKPYKVNVHSFKRVRTARSGHTRNVWPTNLTNLTDFLDLLGHWALGAWGPLGGASAPSRAEEKSFWEFLLSKKFVRFVRFVVTGSVCGAKRAPHTESNSRRELCKVCKTGGCAILCLALPANTPAAGMPQKRCGYPEPKGFEGSGNREKGKSK